MNARRMLLGCAFAVAALAPACSCGKTGSGAPAGSGSTIAAGSGEVAAPPPTYRKTTSGDIAIGNLTGQIKAMESVVASGDPGGKNRRNLIDLLSVRAEYAGKISDLERAAALGEELVKEVPDSAEAYLSRAATRSALHLFDEALSDLDEAEKRGVRPERTRAKRASIAEARGQLDVALSLQGEVRAARKDILTSGVYAVLLGELGRRDEAIDTFREALSSYGDTSPFPVAWLFFRQGQLWEREGRKDLAIAYYEAAVARVPSYAHAVAHLARLVPADRAVTLLAPLLATSDDPEVEAVLADKLRERGDTEGATMRTARAAARYEELVNRHPAAFADHAAQFWLDTGNDPKKALELARINLAARKTARAYELAVLAALSASDRETACTLGTEGLAAPGASSMFRDIVKGACEKR